MLKKIRRYNDKWYIFIIVFMCLGLLSFDNFIKYYPQYNGRYTKNEYWSVDTVWGGSRYRTESYLYTLINGKECIINPNMWYTSYIYTMSKSIVYDDAVNECYIMRDIPEKDDYELVGQQMAFIYRTLVKDEVEALQKRGEKMYLYINTDNMLNSKRVVIFNDEYGNIYVISEQQWRKVNDDK